jgi:peptide/nickel transport system permease protein
MIEVLAAFLRKPAAVAGVLILLAAGLVAASAELLFPFSPWDMRGTPFDPPGTEGFLLGSDGLGRDLAAGICYGARVSLLIGVISAAVSLLIGVTLGATAGYARGALDDLIMRVTEFFQTIPSFVFALLLVAIFTPNLHSIVAAIAIVSWPPVARVVRAEFLSLRSREFVQASEVLGRSHLMIVFGEILPNALSPIIALASLMVANAILLESALSFLGLGDPNRISWGYLIGQGRSVIQFAWWLSVFPGLAIVLTVLSLNLVGEGLTDALDPRASRRRRPDRIGSPQ